MNKISVEVKPNIKTYDIDIAGHVNNIVYLKWFEALRTKLFDKYFNLAELLSKNIYPVVISTEIRYKNYLKLFDQPVAVMCIESFNHGIITVQAEISLNGKIAALGKQSCVLLNLDESAIIKSNRFSEVTKHIQKVSDI